MRFLWAVAVMIVVLSCTGPDEVRVGVGHRQELLGHIDYSGQTGWVEGTWKLKPTTVEFSPETRLFLQNQEAHRAPHAPADAPDVTVNVPAPEKEPEEPDTIDKIANLGKNKEGDWTVLGVAVVLGLGCLVVVYLVCRPSKETAKGDA